MIGLLLRPGSEPEAVHWTQRTMLDQLHLTSSPVWRLFDAPGGQGGQMLAVFGGWSSGPANTHASALLAEVTSATIRGPVLILRPSTEPPFQRSLSDQDCLALAARLVASESPVHGRGGLLSRRGRNRAGRPAPTRGEPC